MNDPNARPLNLPIGMRAIITAGTVVLLYFTTDIGGALRSCLAAEPGILLAAFALSLAQQPMVAWRWQTILRSLGISTEFRWVLRTCLVSTFFGLALPSSNGSDIVRGLMVVSSTPSRASAVLCVLTDRAYGLLSLTFFACAASVWLIQFEKSRALLLGIALGCMAFWILVIALSRAASIRRTAEPQTTFVNRLMVLLGQNVRALMLPLSNLRTLAVCLTLSALSQLLGLVCAWLIGESIGLHLSIVLYFACVPVVWLATSIPVSIAGIGVREASFVLLFGSLGVTRQHAAAIGVLSSAIALLTALVGGLVMLLPDRRSNESVMDDNRK